MGREPEGGFTEPAAGGGPVTTGPSAAAVAEIEATTRPAASAAIREWQVKRPSSEGNAICASSSNGGLVLAVSPPQNAAFVLARSERLVEGDRAIEHEPDVRAITGDDEVRADQL